MIKFLRRLIEAATDDIVDEAVRLFKEKEEKDNQDGKCTKEVKE